MTEYQATVIRTLDAETVLLDVVQTDSTIERVKFRVKDVRSNNFHNKKSNSFDGSRGFVEKIAVDQWFLERSMSVTIDFFTIDIVGRWLGTLKENSTNEFLGQFLIDNFLKDSRWDTANQEQLKDEWFDGQVVTVPDGAELPIFHPWGKLSTLGPQSRLIKRM